MPAKFNQFYMASLERFTDLSEENSVEINRVGAGHTPGEEVPFLCRGDERGGGPAVELNEGSVMREGGWEGYYLN